MFKNLIERTNNLIKFISVSPRLKQIQILTSYLSLLLPISSCFQVKRFLFSIDCFYRQSLIKKYFKETSIIFLDVGQTPEHSLIKVVISRAKLQINV